jgi:hypothetical protein
LSVQVHLPVEQNQMEITSLVLYNSDFEVWALGFLYLPVEQKQIEIMKMNNIRLMIALKLDKADSRR